MSQYRFFADIGDYFVLEICMKSKILMRLINQNFIKFILFFVSNSIFAKGWNLLKSEIYTLK